jgi:rhodanese-like protein
VWPSGAALQLDPSHRSSPSVTRLLAVVLGLAILGWVTAAPADDPEVPERYIKVEQVKAILDQKRRLWLIDVRPREQYDDLHIQGALSIPLSELRNRLGEVPQIVPVVLY